MFSQSFTKLSNCWMIAWKISFSFRVRDKLPKQLKTNPHLQPVFRKWRGENGEDVSKDEGIKLSWAVAEKVMRTVQTLAESPENKPNGWKRRDDWFKNQHHSSLTCSKSQLLCKLPPPTSLTIPELPAFSSPDPRVDLIYCILQSPVASFARLEWCPRAKGEVRCIEVSSPICSQHVCLINQDLPAISKKNCYWEKALSFLGIANSIITFQRCILLAWPKPGLTDRRYCNK